MGINIEVIHESTTVSVTSNAVFPIVYYGPEPREGIFNVFAVRLLSETGIKNINPEVFRDPLMTFLFPSPEGFDLPFDIFSATFFLLSRYEEFLPFKPDAHGRFEADQSLAFRNGFLEDPIIDQWIELFKVSLKRKYPELSFPVQKFRFVSTFDIDNPWAYLHKSLLRTSGGLLRALLKTRANDLSIRLKVLQGKMPDPFNTYQYIRDVERNYEFSSLFFLLSGDYGRYDTNFALKTWYFKELVLDLNFDRTIGIHPSYKSDANFELLESEYNRFSKILGHKPLISRQHFLLLRFPETYHRLIKLGIREDYTMGYATFPGFRAGTSRPFHFYDLINEYETELVIYPFAIMDVTLRQYLSLSPDAALERIKLIAGKVKKVNGTFTSLWHNESLSETGVWMGWRKVFEGMVEEVRSKE
jgi:hypothetical protein